MSAQGLGGDMGESGADADPRSPSAPRRLRVLEPLACLALAGHALAIGATTVVEGVETREQLDLVTDLGCDQAQGYYLSCPLAPDAATRYLRAAAPR